MQEHNSLSDDHALLGEAHKKLRVDYQTLSTEYKTLVGEHNTLIADCQILATKVQRLTKEVDFLKAIFTQGGGIKTGHKRKPPNPYHGKRDDKVLENYMFDMESI